MSLPVSHRGYVSKGIIGIGLSFSLTSPDLCDTVHAVIGIGQGEPCGKGVAFQISVGIVGKGFLSSVRIADGF